MKLSIIVPIYNSEPYLHECIDSVLRQTYQDFECILVDDGSTDHSGTIADECAVKDSGIHVINKKNEGRSSARNTGIEKAAGEYVYSLIAMISLTLID